MKALSTLARALGLLVPDLCGACRAPLSLRQTLWCGACAPPIWGRFADLPFPVWSLYTYEGATRAAVHAFKYQNRPQLARAMGRVLWETLQHDPWIAGWGDAALVPVPTSPVRLVTRGYNAPGLIAQALGRHAGRRVCVRGLSRSVSTQQARLDRKSRLLNVQGAVALRKVPDRSVLLVDDVVTTGATLEACRQALLRAGVEVVGALTFASVPPPETDGVRPPAAEADSVKGSPAPERSPRLAPVARS